MRDEMFDGIDFLNTIEVHVLLKGSPYLSKNENVRIMLAAQKFGIKSLKVTIYSQIKYS